MLRTPSIMLRISPEFSHSPTMLRSNISGSLHISTEFTRETSTYVSLQTILRIAPNSFDDATHICGVYSENFGYRLRFPPLQSDLSLGSAADFTSNSLRNCVVSVSATSRSSKLTVSFTPTKLP